jgi:hypothetical protein
MHFPGGDLGGITAFYGRRLTRANKGRYLYNRGVKRRTGGQEILRAGERVMTAWAAGGRPSAQVLSAQTVSRLPSCRPGRASWQPENRRDGSQGGAGRKREGLDRLTSGPGTSRCQPCTNCDTEHQSAKCIGSGANEGRPCAEYSEDTSPDTRRIHQPAVHPELVTAIGRWSDDDPSADTMVNWITSGALTAALRTPRPPRPPC